MEKDKDPSKLNKSDKKEEESSLAEDILDFIKVFVISAVVILLFVNFVAHPVKVEGESMYPTLVDGDYGFTDVLPFQISNPQRGEVVVVTMQNYNGETEHWVKRVIGLPGETIEARDGVVYINGEPLDESEYLSQDYIDEVLGETSDGYSTGTFTRDFGPITLEEDQFFVMGDNRPYSKDSRDPTVGPVYRSQIFGKDILILWPFSNFGVH